MELRELLAAIGIGRVLGTIGLVAGLLFVAMTTATARASRRGTIEQQILTRFLEESPNRSPQ